MEKKIADKIKKVLKKENVVFVNTAGYYDGAVLRVKIAEFIETSRFEGAIIKRKTDDQKENESRQNIINVLMALEKNGMRPKYKIEQRYTANAYGTFDSRYLVFR